MKACIFRIYKLSLKPGIICTKNALIEMCTKNMQHMQIIERCKKEIFMIIKFKQTKIYTYRIH